MPSNYRRDPFTDADESLLIQGEEHTVPGASPYYVYLEELPRLDSPESIVVRPAATLTTIQPGATAGTDTYVVSTAPTTNYGSSTFMATGRASAPGGDTYRSLLKFDVSGVSGTVTQAILVLHFENTGSPGGYPGQEDIAVHEATSTWAESTVTWNTAPTFNPVAEAVTAIYSEGFYEWDVTSLVSDWVSGASTNYGFLIKNADESTTDNARNFSTSDNSTASYHPALKVYTANASYTIVAKATVPAAGEVAVSYERGALRFNAAQSGAAVEVDYWGTGSPIDAEDVSGIASLIGEGGDGALSVTTGTTTVTAGIKSYTSIFVASGAILQFTDPDAVIGATGAIEIYGTINLASRGYAGGAGGATSRSGKPGLGFGMLGGGGGHSTGNGPGGGGGGGNNAAGTAGGDGTTGTGGYGGQVNPSRSGHIYNGFPVLAGGGGGGGGGGNSVAGGDGGPGGGGLLLQSRTSIYVASTATITAAGGAGVSPRGGGGAGGSILFRSPSNQILATPVVTGGAGNGTGGAGAAGWWAAESI